MTTSKCFFNCGKYDGPITECGPPRIKKIISASIKRDDNYHSSLQLKLKNDPDTTISYHRSCVSTYTSKHHLKRTKQQSSTRGEAPVSKLLRRHDVQFEFQKHCLICGDECLAIDKNNQNRWRRVIACKTIEMKDTLLKICDIRCDSLSTSVKERINGVPTDLHAADAQYHADCHRNFLSNNVMTKRPTEIDNPAFRHIVDVMQSDETKHWNSLELYNMYNEQNQAKVTSDYSGTDHSAETCQVDDIISKTIRLQLIQQLQTHFGTSLIILRVSGCAHILAFKKYLPESLKLVAASDNDDISIMAKKITREVKCSARSQDSYDLNDFTMAKCIDNCNETRLEFISILVSNGEVSKKSVCLCQSIQALISKSFNQIILGYSLKLHYSSGSRELIDLMHDCSYVASYDEVKRFRKSAAKMTSEEPFTFRGLHTDAGLISAWCDNYDLQVYTPNGCRETHAMAIEVTQHMNG